MRIGLHLIAATVVVTLMGGDGWATAPAPTKTLVIEGRVTSIRTFDHGLTPWLVTVAVTKVVSGALAGSTFQFPVHSPARAGLKEGGSYAIEAVWKEGGYTVDETQWRRPKTSVLLLPGRPGMAGDETAEQQLSTLMDDAGALKRALLLWVSLGLSRAGMWKEASAVSRYVVKTEDDPFEACVGQAAVVWQMTEEGPYLGATYKEWEKLRGIVDRIGVDLRVTPEQGTACRDGFHRVTGNFVHRGSMTSDLERASLEKILVATAAYLGFVQSGVGPHGASTSGSASPR